MFPFQLIFHSSSNVGSLPAEAVAYVLGLVIGVLILAAVYLGMRIADLQYPSYRYTFTVKDARTESEKAMATVKYRGSE